MATIGSKKQEKKIAELSKIANEMHPEVELLAFKGAFRMGAQAAVEKSSFDTWEEVTYEPADIRRAFFASLLAESVPYFKKLIGEKNVEAFIVRLKAENEKYVLNAVPWVSI